MFRFDKVERLMDVCAAVQEPQDRQQMCSLLAIFGGEGVNTFAVCLCMFICVHVAACMHSRPPPIEGGNVRWLDCCLLWQVDCLSRKQYVFLITVPLFRRERT